MANGRQAKIALQQISCRRAAVPHAAAPALLFQGFQRGSGWKRTIYFFLLRAEPSRPPLVGLGAVWVRSCSNPSGGGWGGSQPRSHPFASCRVSFPRPFRVWGFPGQISPLPGGVCWDKGMLGLFPEPELLYPGFSRELWDNLFLSYTSVFSEQPALLGAPTLGTEMNFKVTSTIPIHPFLLFTLSFYSIKNLRLAEIQQLCSQREIK